MSPAPFTEESSPAPPEIAVLPEQIKNQIAAGEVIERPASLVKELCENALDAGAGEVRIDLEEGGARLVRITDDGVGMTAHDLKLAFVPHATSKLRAVDDLEHIASLGFRGEALASMGAIARCSIITRPHAESLGHKIENEGGRLSPVAEVGGPAGTCVEVRDLFFNTPARRRFLKRTSTELSRCLDVVQRLALAHVGVGFTLTHDGKRILDVEKDMDLRARIQRLFGKDLAESLVEVFGEDGDTRITGYVAPPRFARRDTSRQIWFLNGRPLRDKILIRCLREGYRGFLADGRQPAAVLNLAMDPAKVDVNVHPAKAEVRFRDERRLFGFLVNALRAAVRSTDMATPGESMILRARGRGDEDPGQRQLPDPGASFGGPRRAANEAFEVREVPGRPFEPGPAPGAALGPGREAPTSAPTPAASGATGARSPWSADEFSGPYLQVAKTYVLRELEDGFEIVDQHALHERVTFERLLAELREGTLEVQGFLVPELVELSPAEVELVGEHAATLKKIGFEVSVFGPRTLALNAMPARLRQSPSELVRGLVGVLQKTGRTPDAREVLEDLLHSNACRSSVMAGDVLDDAEIHELLERASRIESDQTCPHGRPTRVRFTLADLEKAFQRR